jgi:hypothetical protein
MTFRELVGELDLERVMGESVAKGLATMQVTTQDKDIGESEWGESAEKELAVAAKAIKSSTVGKGKRKVVPARAKVYVEMDGLVSNLIHCRQSALTYLLTVQPMLHVEDKAVLHYDTI